MQPTYALDHILGQSLTLKSPHLDQPLWTYVYGGKPKPFFHPLRTPAGFTLTLFEPSDHVWHRGLWFAIKFVNGMNFWEENGTYGCQRTLLPPAVEHAADGSFAWRSEQVWEHPGMEAAVVREKRLIRFVPLQADAYALDWEVELQGDEELLLDRTPFTTWGGYGGLTLRGNRNWLKTRLLFDDGSTSERPTPVHSRWCDLSGLFDGGQDATGGIAILDHPGNLRHPSPWYGATGSGHYFNSAFLFKEALTLPAGELLRLRYRTLVHDGIWEADQLQTAWQEYAGAEG